MRRSRRRRIEDADDDDEEEGEGEGEAIDDAAEAAEVAEIEVGGGGGGGGWGRGRVREFERDVVAGAVMGGAVHTVVAPIERVKLLLQTQEGNAALLGRRRRFRGFVDCVARTVRDEGALSLWRGNGTGVLRYYPSVALNFSLKVHTSPSPPHPNPSGRTLFFDALLAAEIDRGGF